MLFRSVINKAKEDTEIFDYTKGMLTLVDVDFTAYRKKVYNRAVKKNCTIPYWMSVEAEKEGISFSKGEMCRGKRKSIVIIHGDSKRHAKNHP